MDCSEIIKVQFGKKKKTPYISYFFFRIIVAKLSLKNAWLPPIFFLDFQSPNGNQHHISPCNINAYSVTEVMRIKDRSPEVNFLVILITSPQYF